MVLSSLDRRDIDSITHAERGLRSLRSEVVGPRVDAPLSYDARVRDLLGEMFVRKPLPGKAFRSLDPQESVGLWRYLQFGTQSRRWTELHGDLDRQSGVLVAPHQPHAINDAYAYLRHNFHTGTQVVTPTEFGDASTIVTDDIWQQALATGMDPQSTAVLYPLRAGLAFYEGALRRGFRENIMLGVVRSHDKAQASCYLEPAHLRADALKACSDVMIVDPMLATGGSVELSLAYLSQRFGIDAAQVTVASMIAAPEGIARLLSETRIRHIFAGKVDHGLNDDAYIVSMGLGDAGDQLEAYLRKMAPIWFADGKLSAREYAVLCEKLRVSVAA